MDQLPYFQFFSNEWLSGNIQGCSPEVRGIYTDIMAYYWRKDCNLHIDYIEAMVRTDKQSLTNALAKLKQFSIIAIDDDGFIHIKFLLEQYQARLEAHEKRVSAGRKGGQVKGYKKSLSKAKAKPDNISISYSNSNSCIKEGPGGIPQNRKESLNIPGYLNTPEIRAAFVDWLETMDIKGIVFTDTQIDLHFKDLLSLGGPEAALQSIEVATKKGYKGFYPVHSYNGPQQAADLDPDEIKRKADEKEKIQKENEVKYGPLRRV